MVTETRGNMAWMEDQVGFCVCEKELCLSGAVARFFEREAFSPMARLEVFFLLLLQIGFFRVCHGLLPESSSL